MPVLSPSALTYGLNRKSSGGTAPAQGVDPVTTRRCVWHGSAPLRRLADTGCPACAGQDERDVVIVSLRWRTWAQARQARVDDPDTASAAQRGRSTATLARGRATAAR